MSTLGASIAGCLFEAESGGWDSNGLFRDRVLRADEFRARWGDEAGNAYDDLIAVQQRMRKIRQKIENEEIKPRKGK